MNEAKPYFKIEAELFMALVSKASCAVGYLTADSRVWAKATGEDLEIPVKRSIAEAKYVEPSERGSEGTQECCEAIFFQDPIPRHCIKPRGHAGNIHEVADGRLFGLPEPSSPASAPASQVPCINFPDCDHLACHPSQDEPAQPKGTCHQCKIGKDTDGDGHCEICAHWTPEQIVEVNSWRKETEAEFWSKRCPNCGDERSEGRRIGCIHDFHYATWQPLPPDEEPPFTCHKCGRSIIVEVVRDVQFIYCSGCRLGMNTCLCDPVGAAVPVSEGVTPWRDIRNGPPKYGEWAIVVIDGITQRTMCRLLNDSTWEWQNEDADCAPYEVVTHWQPCPEPPAQSLSSGPKESDAIRGK